MHLKDYTKIVTIERKEEKDRDRREKIEREKIEREMVVDHAPYVATFENCCIFSDDCVTME